MSGTGSGGVAVTGESSSGGRSLPVNVLGNGSGGASGQASACAGATCLSQVAAQQNGLLGNVEAQELCWF